MLHHESFTYRLDATMSIEVLRAVMWRPEDVAQLADWQGHWDKTGLGDVLPARAAFLRPLPTGLQAYFDKINSGDDLTEEQWNTMWSLCGERRRHTTQRPYFNQIFGSPIRNQHVPDPECPYCRGSRSKMYPLALLLNDDKRDFRFGYDDYQFLCFVCAKCWSITIECIL
jgi:hypothetical protein